MEQASSTPAPEVAKIAAERILAASFGTLRLDRGTPVDSREWSRVFRFRVLDGADQAPSSVIVKRGLPPGGDSIPGGPSAATRLCNEWASLQFLGEIPSSQPLAPRFYGGDREDGILVMEDLGRQSIDLNVRLLGDDPIATEADLIAYAATVGRMHAGAAGRAADFTRLRAALGSPDPGLGRHWMTSTMHAMLDALGLSAPAELDSDLAVLEASIGDPGPFATLVHADPCPGNWLRTGTTVRLADFEYAHVGHALQDGVYARVAFPTCWCAGWLPGSVTEAMEHTYRTELARGCLAAEDDVLYGRGVAEACAFWLMFTGRIMPMTTLLHEDREWGTGTFRQRLLARLDAVTGATEAFGHLTVLGEVAATMTRELHDRWAGEVVPLPLYPAFRSA